MSTHVRSSIYEILVLTAYVKKPILNAHIKQG